MDSWTHLVGGLPLDRPWVLLGLCLLPVYWLWRRRLRQHDRVAFAPLQLEARRAGRWRRLAWRCSPAFEVLLVTLLLLGLAGPRHLQHLQLLEEEGIDLVLVLDVSLSMLAEDFPPNRLDALRELARQFILQSGQHRLGIVVFAGDTYVQSPPSMQRDVVLELLQGVTVEAISTTKSGGTAIGDALLVASEGLRKVKVEGRDQALILMTDGESNTGSDPVLAARYARDLGIRTYILGIGSERPVPVMRHGKPLGGDTPYMAVLDDAQLKAIAEAAGGRYDRAIDVGSLERLLAELARLEGAPLKGREVEISRSYGPIVAALLLGGFLCFMAVDGLWTRRPLR